MSGAQKTPFARSMSSFVTDAALNLMEQTGKSLPCSVVAVNGGFVTVKFEVQSPIQLGQIKVPQAISRYVRPPTQVGDKGFVVAADVNLGGVSGLGGAANYTRQEANLSTLVFVPLATTAFPSVDANAVWLTGPNGVVAQDDTGITKLTVNPVGVTITHAGYIITMDGTAITLSQGSNSVTIDSGGIYIVGTLYINGQNYALHEHTGVQSGGSNTGPVA